MKKPEISKPKNPFKITIEMDADAKVSVSVDSQATLEHLNMSVLSALLHINSSNIAAYEKALEEAKDTDVKTKVLTLRRMIYQHLDDNITFILDQIDPSVLAEGMLEGIGATDAVKKQINKNKMEQNSRNFNNMIKFPKK